MWTWETKQDVSYPQTSQTRRDYINPAGIRKKTPHESKRPRNELKVVRTDIMITHGGKQQDLVARRQENGEDHLQFVRLNYSHHRQN